MEDSLPFLISQEEVSAELKNAIIARQVSNVQFFFSLHIIKITVYSIVTIEN